MRHRTVRHPAVAPPEVDYQDDAVVITVRVRRIAGDADCQGNPDTPYALDLAEPSGGRTLLDGGRTPPAAPASNASTVSR